MKTLVVHPIDSSTDFLSITYQDIDCTKVRATISKSRLKQLIKDHDRIIMLGHGTDHGLIDKDRFVVDSTIVYLLRQKDCVCIWCNADQFVVKYGLYGRFTGMIISEDIEANMYCIDATFDQMQTSNKMFASAVSLSLDKDDFVKSMKLLYQRHDNPIVQFNRNNIFQTIK